VGTGTIVVSDVGGLGPVRIPVSGLACSWAVSRAGLFSAFIPDEAAKAIEPDRKAWRGRWVRYERPLLPAWGGVVTAINVGTDGDWELIAESFHVLLRKRRTPLQWSAVGLPTGSILRQLLAAISHEDPTWIVLTEADVSGLGISFRSSGEDCYRTAIPALLEAADAEWDVDADRQLRFVPRLGKDLSGAVLLRDGVDAVVSAVRTDMWSAVTDVLGVAGVGQSARSGEVGATQVLVNHAGLVRLGRLQETREHPRLIRHSQLHPMLVAALRVGEDPPTPIEASVLPAAFGRFGLGDTVRLEHAGANARLAWRVETMAYDAAAELLKCTGPAGEWS